jgi:hypothetical protein
MFRALTLCWLLFEAPKTLLFEVTMRFLLLFMRH